MNVESLSMDKEQARDLWRKYKEHAAYSEPHDYAIAAIYKRLAQGRTVIRALDSIRAAGVTAEGLPKLAIMRADVPAACWHPYRDYGYFSTNGRNPEWDRRVKSKLLRVDWPGMVPRNRVAEAQVPLIPVHLRPKRGLENYHILWEAEWTKRYPVDPYLLRRIGTSGDAWLVVAAWDLTPVEQAVMSARL